jgi:two-component system, NtrC family, nitrogen regulation sensor histidine kinase GlnL
MDQADFLMRSTTEAARLAPSTLDMLNALPGPVLCLDPTDTILFANLASEGFFNTSLGYVNERRLTDFLPADSPLIALVREARQQEGSYAEYGVELALLNGHRVVADIVVSALVEHAGWLLVTLQSRSIAHMFNRQMTHQSAARSVVGVAAMLAHEIKNPLSGIRGAAQLLEESAAEDERELTQLICAEADRIVALVDRMETFTDTRTLERRQENIHQILGHVRRIAVNGFARGINLKERYDPSLPDVLANRDKLVQVFLNLVKNAAEAILGDGQTQGEITITTAYRHGVRVALKGSARRVSLPLEVCVIDSGPGAPVELTEHLFDPFVTSKPNGSGLGLALAAKVIGDHGGVIEYLRQAEPPRTVFRILLPVYEA